MHGILRIHLDAFPQAADMGIDIATDHNLPGSPNMLEQFIAGEHAIWLGRQKMQKTKLESGEVNRLAIARHLVGGGVDSQAVNFDGAVGADGEFDAAEESANTGEQFAVAIGLAEVVVGSQFEGDDAVGFLSGTGHYDGQVVEPRIAADGFAKLERAGAGKATVDDQQVGVDLDNLFEPERALAGFQQLEAMDLELPAQPVQQRFFFIRNQDSGQAMAALERRFPGVATPTLKDWIRKANASETECEYSVTSRKRSHVRWEVCEPSVNEAPGIVTFARIIRPCSKQGERGRLRRSCY